MLEAFFHKLCVTTSKNNMRNMKLIHWIFLLENHVNLWVMFFNAHSKADVSWTSSFSIHVMHALLRHKIFYSTFVMPKGLKFASKQLTMKPGPLLVSLIWVFFKDNQFIGYAQKNIPDQHWSRPLLASYYYFFYSKLYR